jgi:hypothetical protein
MYPLIASDLPVEDLLAALAGATGVPFRRLPPEQDAIDPAAEGEPLLAGYADGRSYLFDVGVAMLASLRGLQARLAAERDCLVVSAVYDDLEEQCEFFAARGREVLRVFWYNPRRTTRPYSVGEPLPTEASCPLASPGPAGLVAALRHFGCTRLDSRGEFERLPDDFIVAWQGDAMALTDRDELDQRIGQHIREHWRPDYQPPEFKVNVRIRTADEGIPPQLDWQGPSTPADPSEDGGGND